MKIDFDNRGTYRHGGKETNSEDTSKSTAPIAMEHKVAAALRDPTCGADRQIL